MKIKLLILTVPVLMCLTSCASYGENYSSAALKSYPQENRVKKVASSGDVSSKYPIYERARNGVGAPDERTQSSPKTTTNAYTPAFNKASTAGAAPNDNAFDINSSLDNKAPVGLNDLAAIGAVEAKAATPATTTTASGDDNIAQSDDVEDICGGVRLTGPHKVGKPYVMDGVTYYPMEDAKGYTEVGMASWYGPNFHGKLTSNGEIYNQNAMTAAHKTLPMPTLVLVQNLENGREVVVRINDRGPYSKGRIIDLTYAAAKRLGMIQKGTARVKISVLSENKDCYVTRGKPVDISQGDFSIQLAAFQDINNAKRVVKQYGDNATISTDNSTGTEWNRVFINGFSTEEEAEAALKKYSSDFSDAFIIRNK